MATLGTESFAFFPYGVNKITISQMQRRGWTLEGASYYHKYDGPFGAPLASIRSSAGPSQWAKKPLSSAQTTLWLAGYWKCEQVDFGTIERFLRFYEGSTMHIDFVIDTTTGLIGAYRGQSPTNLLGKSTLAMPKQTWVHFQIEVTISDTVGVVNLWIDDVQYLNITGADTDNGGASGNIDNFKLGSINGAGTSWAELAWWSTSGDAPTGKIAQHRVEPIWPESDSSVQFTPQGAGTNNVEVDETYADDDTTYNESSTVGHKDRFNMYTTGASYATIYAVNAVALARMDDAGPRSIRVGVYSGTTEDRAASAALAQTYKHFEHLMTLNPDDSAAWAQADIDALQAQYEVSA